MHFFVVFCTKYIILFSVQNALFHCFLYKMQFVSVFCTQCIFSIFSIQNNYFCTKCNFLLFSVKNGFSIVFCTKYIFHCFLCKIHFFIVFCTKCIFSLFSVQNTFFHCFLYKIHYFMCKMHFSAKKKIFHQKMWCHYLITVNMFSFTSIIGSVNSSKKISMF